VTVRILFLGEGTSDSGIVPQIERIASGLDIEIVVTDPDLSRLPNPPGRAVVSKLSAALEIGGKYELIVVHRDADRDGRNARLTEISNAISSISPDSCFTAVIPVRMTEAWLLTDETALREVAGNPKGRIQLNLPALTKVESMPDPKQVLKDALGLASGLSGRKLQKFHTRFPQHRRQLLERLNPEHKIRGVSSWQCFVADMESGLKSASNNTR
jgi:hypothetical protein